MGGQNSRRLDQDSDFIEAGASGRRGKVTRKTWLNHILSWVPGLVNVYLWKTTILLMGKSITYKKPCSIAPFVSLPHFGRGDVLIGPAIQGSEYQNQSHE